MSKSLFRLTPCPCERHKLSRRQLWIFGVSMIGMVVVIEGGVAIHMLTAGDTAASMLVFGGWMRDAGKEIVKHLLEDA